MKTRVTLSTGGFVELEHKRPSIVETIKTGANWIEDDNGVLVNVAHIVAFEPITEPSPPEGLPSSVIDGDGDEWILDGEALYCIRGLLRQPLRYLHTLAEIEEWYGIHERMWSGE